MEKYSKKTMIQVLENMADQVKSTNLDFYIPNITSGGESVINRICHPFPELFFNVAGVNILSMKDEKHTMASGQIALIPSSTLHHESNPGPEEMRHIVLMLKQDAFSIHWAISAPGITPKTTYSLSYEHKRNSNIEMLVSQYIKSRNKKSDAILQQGLKLAIIGQLLNYLKNKTPRIDNAPEKIKFVRLIIDERLSDSALNVAALAQMTRCNADYLSHLFMKETGITLTDYINGKRLDAAAKYLENTDMSISETAWSCGYSSPSYFIARFKKKFHMSPGNYRHQQH